MADDLRSFFSFLLFFFLLKPKKPQPPRLESELESALLPPNANAEFTLEEDWSSDSASIHSLSSLVEDG